MRCCLIFFWACCLAACGDSGSISDAGAGAFEPDLEVMEDGAVVAWHDNRHGGAEIYLRVLDRKLRPVSPEMRLTRDDAASYEADAVVTGGEIAVAWYDKDKAGHLAVKVGLWTRRGETLWIKQVSSPYTNGRIPVLKAFNDRLFMAWVEDPPDDGRGGPPAPSIVYGAWLNTRGGYLSRPFHVGHASADTWNLNAGVSGDGQIALVFDAGHATRANEIYLAKISHNRSDMVRLSADDGIASKYPDIALNGSTAALAWFDAKDGNNEVYLNFFNILAVSSYDDFPRLDHRPMRITHTDGDSIGAYLTWNGNTLGLAWNDDEPGQHDIYFQRFNAAKNPLAPPLRLTRTATDSLIPSIQPLDRGFALAWNEVMPGAGAHGAEPDDTIRSRIYVRHVK